MKPFPGIMRKFFIASAVLLAFVARGETVETINGDRYVGHVLSMDEKELKLESEVLGKIKIARSQIVSIQFKTVASKAAAPQPSPWSRPSGASGTNKLDINSQAIEKVQQEFLATATPEANALFSELLGGLTTGKLNENDLRNMAQESLAQLQQFQKELGNDSEDSDPFIGNYVAILENFIKGGGGASTNKVTRPRVPVPQQPPAHVTEDK